MQSTRTLADKIHSLNDPQENPAQHRFYQLGPGSKLSEFAVLEDALSAFRKGSKIWLDFSNPSKDLLLKLVEPLGLHPLAIEDCLDDEQIPKAEDFPSNIFILFNRYIYSGTALSILEVDFFLGKQFLVTVNLRNNGGRYFAKLEESVRQDPTNVQRGPDFLLHIILDHIVDEKFSAIESLQQELDRLEDQVLQSPTDFNPALLVDLRRNLLTLRKSLFHEREILVKICRRDSPFISEKAIYHFRDIYDHLAKSFELTESFREIIASLMEMYLSLLNNQMTLVANRTNQIVRRLTMITTIFMPLTLLAGIGGMSEWSMITGPGNWKTAYPLFFLGMLLLGVLSYYLLKAIERREETRIGSGHSSKITGPKDSE